MPQDDGPRPTATARAGPVDSAAVEAAHRTPRLLVHLAEDRLEAVDPRDVYLLEAARADTLLRLRRAEPLRDVRRFHEVVERFEPFGFLRIHRSYAVNLDRIREVRLREDRRDWEVKLDPPVHRVLPVSRAELHRLWEAVGEQR